MTDDIEENRRQNLAKLVVKVGSQAALAQKCRVAKQQISGVLTGKKRFGERAARKIEVAVGLKLGDLDKKAADLEIPPQSPPSSDVNGTLVLPAVEKITALEIRKEYALIAQPKTSKIRTIEFDGEWLFEQQINTNAPKALKLLSVPSDNMEPEILKGASVVVDISQHVLNANGIYVVAYSGSFFIHRVQVLPGGRFMFLSDNPRYQPFTVDRLDGIVVVGRCVLVNDTHGI